MTVGAVLFSEMTSEPDWEARFHEWYNTKHIPLRMKVPGFIGAQRYANTAGRGHLAVYDMEQPETLKSAAYGEVKDNPSDETRWMLANVKDFTRYIGRLSSWQMNEGVSEAQMLNSPYLYSVMFEVPEARRADFDEWYVQDHVPLLLKDKRWLGCRRYDIVDGDPGAYTHLALHHVASPGVLDSPARAEARASDWRARLAKEDWFKGVYTVFSRTGGRFQGVSGPSE